MEAKPILIVDDEKNIRLTMSQALDPLGMPVETAVNGEDALEKSRKRQFGLVFLDLKMPGMDGMDVLRQIKEMRSKTRVIIVTAHGTIRSAVDAMKLGAVDFIQKPFSPKEIRRLAKQVLDRETLDEETAADYGTFLELAKRHITDSNFELAAESARKAIAADPDHPEGYNLLGAVLEIKGDWAEAHKFYRAALSIDPAYKPAQENLERSASWSKSTTVDLGSARDREASRGDADQGEEDEK